MMDIMTGLTAISETLKISKELRQIDAKISEAEFKLRLADLVDGLLEAKEALQDAKENERELENRVRELENALSAKASTVEDGGFIYKVDENGERLGPYCHPCHETSGKFYRLAEDDFAGGHGFECPNCEKLKFTSRSPSVMMVRVDRDPFDRFLLST